MKTHYLKEMCHFDGKDSERKCKKQQNIQSTVGQTKGKENLILLDTTKMKAVCI